MPLIIIKTDGHRFVVQGGPQDIKRWRPGRFIEVTELTGAKVAFNTDYIDFVSWMTDEQYTAQKQRQEEAARKNPSPGREPRLVTPRTH